MLLASGGNSIVVSGKTVAIVGCSIPRYASSVVSTGATAI